MKTDRAPDGVRSASLRKVAVRLFLRQTEIFEAFAEFFVVLGQK
jgi:hypothetical protein